VLDRGASVPGGGANFAEEPPTSRKNRGLHGKTANFTEKTANFTEKPRTSRKKRELHGKGANFTEKARTSRKKRELHGKSATFMGKARISPKKRELQPKTANFGQDASFPNSRLGKEVQSQLVPFIFATIFATSM
jgi:hypothetical protein